MVLHESQGVSRIAGCWGLAAGGKNPSEMKRQVLHCPLSALYCFLLLFMSNGKGSLKGWTGLVEQQALG